MKILVQAKDQEKLYSKNTQFFILVPIASSLISSPVVDQHPVAVIDDEPIRDVDLVALDVDIVVPDVVMNIPLKRSERARRLAISNDYIVYLQKHKYDVGDVSDSLPTKKLLLVLNFKAAPEIHL